MRSNAISTCRKCPRTTRADERRQAPSSACLQYMQTFTRMLHRHARFHAPAMIGFIAPRIISLILQN